MMLIGVIIMKKFSILIFILTSTCVFASCPIDGSSDACSLAEIQQSQPMERINFPSSTIKEYSGIPDDRIKQSQDNKPRKNLRDFGPQTNDYSYNTSCQFGICNTTGTPQLFEKRQ